MSPARAPTRLVVVGANGRMGQAILRLAGEDGGGFVVVGEVSEGDDLEKVIAAAPRGAIAIDFSAPAATRALAGAAAKAGVGVVCGTTGLDEDAEAALAAAARAVPVFTAANMSVGVHVLAALVERAITMLGDGFDVEIVEAHHKRKVDAPSGTALRLFEIASTAKKGAQRKDGRTGRPGARPTREIGLHAVRGGDVIGDHTVHLLGDGERIELTHRASNRDLFARGALRAARFLDGRPPGRYGMDDLFKTA